MLFVCKRREKEIIFSTHKHKNQYSNANLKRIERREKEILIFAQPSGLLIFSTL
jgi:hypothetical protein